MNNVYIKNKFGFSLIELSIVLIIIGLLVAGITGGSSLIKSAKIRAFINEINNYKRAYNSYYVATGSFPGDDGSGRVGYLSIFNGGLEEQEKNPFTELYEENIIDFKPNKNTINRYDNDLVNVSPKINSLGNGYFVFAHNSLKSINILMAVNPMDQMELQNLIPSKDAKSIDTKIDDGLGLSGKMQSICEGNSYFGSTGITAEAKGDYDSNENCGGLIFSLDI